MLFARGRTTVLCLTACLAGIAWLAWGARPPAVESLPPAPDLLQLRPGSAAAIGAPALSAWVCRPSPPPERATTGAPLPCPPGAALSGEFVFTGRALWLNLQRGDAFAVLLVGVDGAPANALNAPTGARVSPASRRAYLPLYSPFEHARMRPVDEWLLAHAARDDGPHHVVLEIAPGAPDAPSVAPDAFLQGVGVDLPVRAGRPYWPGLLALALGLAGLGLSVLAVDRWPEPLRRGYRALLAVRDVLRRRIPATTSRQAGMAGACLLLIGAGQRTELWWLCLPGLIGLGLVGLQRPAFWLGALLFGLPFYLYPLPLGPGLALNLVEVGVWGGAVLAGLQYCGYARAHATHPPWRATTTWIQAALWALALVALLSAGEAQYRHPALREWRTVFLAGAMFFTTLVWILRMSPQRDEDIVILLSLWLGGAVAIAAFGYYAYLQGVFVTDVDGVRRIRGLFGSPNNLALYLERAWMVALGLFLYASAGRKRALWGGATLLLSGAVALTFSRGALLLGLPAGLLFLVGCNVWRRRQWADARRNLWWLGGLAVAGLLLLAPFLNTPRFAGLLDWQGSFPTFVRTHLWRSGWHAFLDHPWLGLGPDNFLYWYRGFYVAPAVWNEPSLNHPHNLVLDLLSRLGAAGFAAAVACGGLGLGLLWRQIGAARPNKAALGFAAAAVAGAAHGLVDASYALPELFVVWGLLCGLWSLPDTHCAQQRLLN